MKKLTILFILSLPFFAFCQQYYGKNGTCKLSLLSDSSYSISAYSFVEEDCYDTGYYRINNDTMYLTSARPICITISATKDTDNMRMEHDKVFIIKGYRIIEGKPTLSFEYGTSKQYIEGTQSTLFCPYTIYEGDIIVIYDNWIYRRSYLKQKDVSQGQCLVGFFLTMTPDKESRVYFESFPLLIKKGCLVPLDDYKNYETWVYNGFYVPKMVLKEQKSHTKCLLHRGAFDFE